MSELLRKLAEQLRQEDARRHEVTQEKCAQIVRAARGIGLLQQKLTSRRAS